MTGSITSITYAPVKGLGLVHAEEVELELTGVRDNRRFHLRLVRVNEPGAGSDRGIGASVSVVSSGTLDRLAREAGEERIDGRRFRMLFGLDGVEAHAEDSWVGRRVALGDAVVRLQGLVGRCAVTTHDPDTGVPDLDTLRVLTGYRSDVESDEPLPIGVWGGVEQPGRVRVGDPVEPL